MALISYQRGGSCQRGFSYQRGFTLVETIVVLFIAAMLVGMGGVWAQQYSEHQLVTMVADHQKAVAGATNHFIRDNYTDVLSRANAGPLTIGVQELISKELLPVGFSSTNAFGQSYRIVVIKPQANHLKTMIVTEDGDVIHERLLRKIVRHLGAAGGRISNQNAEGVIDASLVSKVQGADEGWTEPLSLYGVSPGVGHLASAIFHQDGEEVENYLHRKLVPGKPELNQMQTTLEMGGNDIKSAGKIHGQSAELTGWVTAQDKVTAPRLEATDKVTTPHLEATTKVTAPYVWGKTIEGDSAAINGELKAGSVHSAGRLSTGEFVQMNGYAVEGGACTGDKVIAIDANTKLTLSCQSGSWVKTYKVQQPITRMSPATYDTAYFGLGGDWVGCHPDEIIVGGGASCLTYDNINWKGWIHHSEPRTINHNHGWFADCYDIRGRDATARAYAICLKK